MSIEVVVGILCQQDCILVGERPQGKPYSGYWEFPGGKIEPNESAEAALKRELYEELGISVQKAYAWFQHAHTYPDKTVFLHIWVVDQFEGLPSNKEHAHLKWVTVDEITQLRILEGNAPIIDRIKTFLRRAK